jgi:hypothetical protein
MFGAYRGPIGHCDTVSATICAFLRRAAIRSRAHCGTLRWPRHHDRTVCHVVRPSKMATISARLPLGAKIANASRNPGGTRFEMSLGPCSAGACSSARASRALSSPARIPSPSAKSSRAPANCAFSALFSVSILQVGNVGRSAVTRRLTTFEIREQFQ